MDASVRITLIDRDVLSYFQSLEDLLRCHRYHGVFLNADRWIMPGNAPCGRGEFVISLHRTPKYEAMLPQIVAMADAAWAAFEAAERQNVGASGNSLANSATFGPLPPPTENRPQPKRRQLVIPNAEIQ